MLNDYKKWDMRLVRHTMDHINIAKTATEDIVEDCRKSIDILKSRCGDVKHFAFPYGRFFHFSEIGRKAVFASGFASCASAERGCHVNPDRDISNGRTMYSERSCHIGLEH